MAGSYGFDAIDGSSITLALVGEDGHERDRARCTVYLGFPSALPPDREWTGVALADWQCLTGADNTAARRTRVDTLVPARGRQDAARARHWQIDLRPGTPGGALLTDLFVAPNHLGAICHGVGLDAIRADWALGPCPSAPRRPRGRARRRLHLHRARRAPLRHRRRPAYAPTPSPPPAPIPRRRPRRHARPRPRMARHPRREAMHPVLSSTAPTAEGTLRTAIGERPCRGLLVDRARHRSPRRRRWRPGLHCRLTLTDAPATLTGPCHAIAADGTLPRDPAGIGHAHPGGISLIPSAPHRRPHRRSHRRSHPAPPSHPAPHGTRNPFAPSCASSHRFRHSPPAYPTSRPSDPITR
ncbi:MAG: hypothetical protein R3F65_30235 [bacterium]